MLHPNPRLEDIRLKVAAANTWVIASIALATLLLAWPSFLNRGPFFIADTTGYLRSADAAFSSILGRDTIWSDKRELYEDRGTQEQSAAQIGSAEPKHPPLIGRSIYYGAFIYPVALFLGEHAGVLVQAGLAAIFIWLALIPMDLTRRRARLGCYFGAVTLLALATALPFTATLLVPDYLTGVACGSLILLLCFWGAYRRWQIVILAALIALAALSHSSNLPLLLCLSIIALSARKWARLSGKAVLIGMGAVVLGFAGDAIFISAVTQKTGMTPIRPPFLTARLIADGPGHKMLRARCATEAFEVCRYVARTPHDSDLFLWSEAADGVFSVADLASQRELSEQDMRFAIATFREYPLLTLASSGEAFARQLALLDLRIWHGDAGGKPFYDLGNLPSSVAQRMAKTASVRGAFPVQFSQSLISVVALASLLIALWCLIRSWKSDDELTRKIGLALALVILGILANAAITGGLSKPDARYNLRIIWLLPFFVYLLAYRISTIGKSVIGEASGKREMTVAVGAQ